MKLSKIVHLISLIILVSGWLQSCATAPKNVPNPMTNEDLQYFNKYIGKWGGTWTHFDVGKRGARDRDIEITIQKINAEKRKAFLIFSIGESYQGNPGVTFKRQADCIANKIIFSTKNFDFELGLQGEYLRVFRKGVITQETFLKRMPIMREEKLDYFRSL